MAKVTLVKDGRTINVEVGNQETQFRADGWEDAPVEAAPEPAAAETASEEEAPAEEKPAEDEAPQNVFHAGTRRGRVKK